MMLTSLGTHSVPKCNLDNIPRKKEEEVEVQEGEVHDIHSIQGCEEC